MSINAKVTVTNNTDQPAIVEGQTLAVGADFVRTYDHIDQRVEGQTAVGATGNLNVKIEAFGTERFKVDQASGADFVMRPNDVNTSISGQQIDFTIRRA